MRRALRNITLQIKGISPRGWFQQLILKLNETSYHPYPETSTSYNSIYIVKVFLAVIYKKHQIMLDKGVWKEIN
jgi:hypothetical protein